jgi:hypothetical protein
VSVGEGTTAAHIEIEQMWTLNDDRQSVKLSLPPLPLRGLPEPLRLTTDFDADMVEEMLTRLTLLRQQIRT